MQHFINIYLIIFGQLKMIIIKSLALKNYKNIKEENLDNFKDLNILIGPNNCGKSNLLKAIDLLKSLVIDKSNYTCEHCRKESGFIRERLNDYVNVKIPLHIKDSYLEKGRTELYLTFDNDGIEKIVPDVLNKYVNFFKNRYTKPIRVDGIDLSSHICENVEKLSLKARFSEEGLFGNHISMYSNKNIINRLKKTVLFIPEERLSTYKNKSFEEYIDKTLERIAWRTKWIKYLKELIDPNINDAQREDLVRQYGENEFTTKILDQGSGVRSAVCLIADLISQNNSKIVLIDEPELGLNPAAKHSLLKFLVELSKEKQIFITTQDPTFINPILWQDNDVGLYFYSSYKKMFVKTNLNQGKYDINTFAGYLPHTVSLKKIHLYFEGPSDVYIFQVFLEKYLKDKYKRYPHNTWVEVMSRVGMYHLGGDFWSHLLYTIPRYPYKCLLILDGDKKNNVKEVIQKHNDSDIISSKLKFCRTLRELDKFFGNKDFHPVYCLKYDCIEKYLELPIARYLDSSFDCKNPPSNYLKKVHGVKNAEKMTKVPEEIAAIFDTVFAKKH